jgi:hypothetical protein
VGSSGALWHKLGTNGGEERIGSNTINPPAVLSRNSSDDEILGLLTESRRRTRREANHEGRDAWQEARAYRETFAMSEEARAATASLGDLNRMDALFFSRRPEDDAGLARAVSNLNPEAFASLARAMNALANDTARKPGDSARTSGRREWFADQANRTQQPAQAQAQDQIQNQETNQSRQREAGTTLSPAQMEYFHCTNAAAIE